MFHHLMKTGAQCKTQTQDKNPQKTEMHENKTATSKSFSSHCLVILYSQKKSEYLWQPPFAVKITLLNLLLNKFKVKNV